MSDLTVNSTVGSMARTGSYIETEVYGRKETGITVVDDAGYGTFFPDQTALPDVEKYQRRASFENQDSSPTLDALYPQWAEERGEAAVAVRLVSKALNDLERLLESCTSDIEALNYAVLAETQLFQALPKARFNRAFEIVVSFGAWGIRNSEFGLLEEELKIRTLCNVLRELSEKPFLSIGRASELIAALEQCGWSGESPVSQAFDEGLEAAFGNAEVEIAW